MKEILIKLLDILILNDQIQDIKDEKIEAVNKRDYELAAKLREREVELASLLPTTAAIKEWQNKLINS